MKPKLMALSSLVLDFTIYPRVDVDARHISYMREALRAGADFPPIVINAKTKQVIDGFHRVKTYQHEYDGKCKVSVLPKDYASEAEMVLDSIRYNASHGRALSRYDRTHCIMVGDNLHIPEDELASAMAMTIDSVGKLRVERIGTMKVGKSSRPTPLKRTIGHMAGKTLTKRQAETNERLGGMNQGFYVNQVILLIESGLLNRADEQLMAKLLQLKKLLRGL
jgi:hypothetical protein